MTHENYTLKSHQKFNSPKVSSIYIEEVDTLNYRGKVKNYKEKKVLIFNEYVVFSFVRIYRLWLFCYVCVVDSLYVDL